MSAVDDAWQAALAAEHQAVFGYSVLGPQLAATEEQRAITDSNAHEALRDATESALAAAGFTPTAAQADYPALYPVPDAGAAHRLAVRLEDDCAAAWRYLYAQAAATRAASATRLRPTAQAALTASAVRASRWRVVTDPTHPTAAFPGI